MPIPKLMAGWLRFRNGRYREQREVFDRVAREGQNPHTLMVACCDSRVDPAILFDCDPGDLFVVRNVANLVPHSSEAGDHLGTIAAVEFAVRALKVRHIVVLGHSKCGGIRALLEGLPQSAAPMSFVERWVGLAAEARERALAATFANPEDRADYCEQLSVGVSLRNLMSYPAVARSVERRELSLHGMHYDLRKGELWQFDPTPDRFVRLVGDDERAAPTG